MSLKMIIIIIFIVLFIIAIWYITVYNKLKRFSIKIKEALSGIDVALTKRYDVLTKMIEVVKGYTKHEKEVLFEVTKIRQNMTISEMREANNNMDDNMKKINLLVENYPDIKANENFMVLQKSIIDVEEHLQAARRVYNYSVSQYNQLVESFPSLIVAKLNNHEICSFFEADAESKKDIKEVFKSE